MLVSSAGLGMIVSGFLASSLYNIPTPHSIQIPMFYAIFIMAAGFVLILFVCFIDKFVYKHDTEMLRI